jgi:signal transduction histidine kinase
VSLFGRIATTGAALFATAVLLALLVWKPRSQESFTNRTDGLLRGAERDFVDVATSLVDEAMTFSASAALAADEQRALALQDLPLVLYTDAEGNLDGERLREEVRAALTDPEASGARKHGVVRAEILDRTRQDVEERLQGLRRDQGVEAAQHAEQAAWRTVAAWGGMLLLLLAGFAVVLDRVVLRPLRAATTAVGRFGAGERGVRLEPTGGAELAALGRAFNETAAAVERTERENAELRSGLEEKVRERTVALVRAARASTAGTMASGVAHEFNNLLSGILGCADAALGEEPPREVAEALSMIRKTAERGVGVTRALLRATRAEPERARCDLPALFEEALAEVRPPPGIQVARTFVPAPLDADSAMLRSVLANLIRNAVEAMGGEGRLDLRVAPLGAEVLVEVQDDGPGIDPAVQGILFEPFVTTRRGGREGAGLGLFLAESLVHAHGGRIEVDSPPGGGTRFRIRLPSARHS